MKHLLLAAILLAPTLAFGDAYQDRATNAAVQLALQEAAQYEQVALENAERAIKRAQEMVDCENAKVKLTNEALYIKAKFESVEKENMRLWQLVDKLTGKNNE